MSDSRLTPANGRVAALRLKGQVEAERFTEGEPRQVARAVTDLFTTPGGRRERQLIHGEAVIVYEDRDGLAFVEAARIGHVGYVETAALTTPEVTTMFVEVSATHLYPAPDIKSREVMHLSFGARLRIVSGTAKWSETSQGHFLPKAHLRPVNRPFADPAMVAQLHFGAPYLWGGNSIRGIDCSGLVQAAMLACGIPCPGDSDLQAQSLGAELAEDEPLKRGDLVFWKGHVAMAVDGETLIHANAHAMAVTYEGVAETIARVEAMEGSKVIARRRVG